MPRYEATPLSTDLPEYLNRPSRPFHTGTFFVGRKRGMQAYADLKSTLLEVPEGNPMILKFTPAQLMDAAYTQESLARIGKEIAAGKFGERCILLEGLEADSITTLKAVIGWLRLKIAFLTVETSGTWNYVGNLAPHLVDTLKLVARHEHMAIKKLSKLRDMQTNAASNRLNRLHALRLVRREGVSTEHGLIYIYHFWKWSE